MKNFITLYCIPFIIAVCIVLKLESVSAVNQLLFDKKSESSETSSSYISNFIDSPSEYQNWFLQSDTNSDVIFLLGSSELTTNNEAIPYNFINKHFSTKLNAVGHAGNQCFSIYSQLLANEEKLKNAPIVISISPIWFQSNYAQGTAPSMFFEYSTEKYLSKIIHNDSIGKFKNYEALRLLDYYKTCSSPMPSLTLFNLMALSSKNILFKIFYSPLISSYKALIKAESIITNTQKKSLTAISNFTRKTIVQDSVYINWDSLFIVSKTNVLKKATNNNWAVNDNYYSTYVNGKHRMLDIVDDSTNQELKDFDMLLKLVADKKVNASFIILPMSPYCYTNLNDITPLVSGIDKKIKDHNFKCLNMWVTDTAQFDKGILTDIMHPSEYGWYKIDKFIVETYNLNKLKND